MTTPHEHSAETEKNPVDGEQKPSIDQIDADIEQTRDELSATIQALAERLDVKTRAKKKVSTTKEQALVHLGAAQTRAAELTRRARNASTDSAGKPKPTVWIPAGVVTITVIAAAVGMRRRR
jgi:Protein of unknown function (DUF3618)